MNYNPQNSHINSITKMIESYNYDEQFTAYDVQKSLRALEGIDVAIAHIDAILEYMFYNSILKKIFDDNRGPKYKKRHKDVATRLSDLEVKYKWLEEVVAKLSAQVEEKDGKPGNSDDYNWRPWDANAKFHNEMPVFYSDRVDVMYADGVICHDVGSNIIIWDNSVSPDKRIVAWRKTN